MRYFRGRVSNFNQPKARKHCFLTSDWLKFETLPRKYRTQSPLTLTPSLSVQCLKMRSYRSTPDEDVGAEIGVVGVGLGLEIEEGGGGDNATEIPTEEMSNSEVIGMILTHYIYYILLGAFILIFIGIYCVCR